MDIFEILSSVISDLLLLLSLLVCFLIVFNLFYLLGGVSETFFI